ncbi:hypothetical protein BFW01_g7526 [Lasiodiplodia theobromae]|uniref:Translocation protein sec63 n=1 Tax=Lasiodiplodia theobromae TaxID=45133 RepID=UPI0015C35BB7|nr:Translocation protein sec63 [Lasiodiplodia theobromae]KAF4537683.1 Translocation protein sec63 [Lasiodiplodia theobromae]KAF9636630.1 hypothetical protein BFW01_g7526 [Lasiodiplodia theobromae]
MKVASVILAVLFAVGSNACALYQDCKCHDKTTGQQNDAATKAACNYYRETQSDAYTYSDEPHHQCSSNAVGDGLIDNCKWDDACKAAGGPNMYQYCWNKFPW